MVRNTVSNTFGGGNNAAAAPPPAVSVMLRGGNGTVPMPACQEVSDATEIVISLDDAEGLARAEISFSGVISDADFVVSPGGDDVTITEAGVPGSEQVIVTFNPATPGAIRVSSTISFTTQPPFTGDLRLTVTDQAGSSSQVGPFRLALEGGC